MDDDLITILRFLISFDLGDVEWKEKIKREMLDSFVKSNKYLQKKLPTLSCL